MSQSQPQPQRQVPSERGPRPGGLGRRMYRVRSGGAAKTSISLSPQTVEGIHEIRRQFQRRYPKEAYPSLSAVLDSILIDRLKDYDRHPEWLVEVLKLFKVQAVKKSSRQVRGVTS